MSPAHRRQGVCRALLDRAVTEAKLEGLAEVELSSWAFNTDALAAFRALGFQPRFVRFHRDG